MPSENTVSKVSFISGCLSGGAGILVGHPLDTLKVRAQTGITSTVSLRSLYAGLYAPLISTGSIQAINLGIFQNTKNYITRHQEAQRVARGDYNGPSVLEHALVSGVSGSLSGISISALTAPLVRIKLIQQTYQSAFWQTAKQLSLRTAYAGLGLQAIIEAGRGPYMAAYFGCLHILKKHFLDEGVSSVVIRVVCGAAAGVTGWLSIYPFDVVRSVMMTQPMHTPPHYATSWDCAKDLVARHGVSRLFRGLSYTLLRAGPVAAVVLPVYDITLSRLSLLYPDLT